MILERRLGQLGAPKPPARTLDTLTRRIMQEPDSQALMAALDPADAWGEVESATSGRRALPLYDGKQRTRARGAA